MKCVFDQIVAGTRHLFIFIRERSEFPEAGFLEIPGTFSVNRLKIGRKADHDEQPRVFG